MLNEVRTKELQGNVAGKSEEAHRCIQGGKTRLLDRAELAKDPAILLAADMTVARRFFRSSEVLLCA